MNGNRFPILAIRILAALIFAGLIFLVWIPKPEETDPNSFDEVEIETWVASAIAAQETNHTTDQAPPPALTPTDLPATLTSTTDPNQGQTTLKASLAVASATPSATVEGTLLLSLTPTAVTAPTQTITPGNSPTVTWTNTPSPSPTWTPVVSHTPTHTSTHTPSPTTSPSPTPTWTPIPARLSGQVLLNGSPVDQNVILILEDQSYNQIVEVMVSTNGSYVINNVPSSTEGYNLLFTQDLNSHLGVYEVFSYGWFGPIVVADGAEIILPDFDIGLQGFETINPVPDSSIELSTITSQTPLIFQWVVHPYASEYWLTLLNSDLEKIWGSESTTEASASFNGTLDDGSQIQAGQYWWRVSLQGPLNDFTITASAFLDGFSIVP